MSALALRPVARMSRALQAAVRMPLPVSALLASRAIVIAAGVAGGLAVPWRAEWTIFDPTQLTRRLGAVGNVLAAPAIRWDSIHYLAIAGHGYASPASTAFFPLYPMLVRAVGFPLGSDPLAGVIVSYAALAVGLVLLHRLTSLELGPRAADATVLLLAFAPLSFFFTAVYTESLFLALSVGSVYAARRGRWRSACGLGALAAATRVTGAGLVIPLAIMFWPDRRTLGTRALWLLAVPAGLAGYLGYLAVRGYGLLSPFTQQTSGLHQHRMTGPIDTIVSAVRAAAVGLRSIGAQPAYQPSIGGPFSSGFESILLLAVLVLALGALWLVFRRLPVAYGAYALATLLVCVWSPVAGQPLKSLDRYTLTIFPLWMVAGAWVSERRATRTVVLVSAGLLAFWTYQFASWAWVA